LIESMFSAAEICTPSPVASHGKVGVVKMMPRAVRRIKTADEPRPTREVRKNRLARGAQVAWWLTVDVDVCAVCGEGYAYGTGYRCSGCDAAVCAFCIEHRGGEFWCLEC